MSATRETFVASARTDLHRVDLNHTASAALIGDASDSDDPTPSEIEHYRMGWWWGLTCGGCAVGLVMGAAALSFLAGVFS